MSAHQVAHLDPHERRELRSGRAGLILLAAGALVLIVGYLLAGLLAESPRRFWLAYVHNYAYFLSLSLGALFFVLLQHLTRSGWSVVVRRPAEVVAVNLILLAVMFVPLALVVAGGTGVLYPWAQPASVFEHHDDQHGDGAEQRAAAAADNHTGERESEFTEHESDGVGGHGEGAIVGHEAELILEKRPYLNAAFFILRWVVYFAVWAGLAWWYFRRSLRQDETGDVGLTTSMEKVSGPAMLAFALTATLASFDLLMSLDPIWFSTIFGVYYFAGAVIGFFALMIVLLAGLQRRGLLAVSVSDEHYHDLGKLLFGFVFFWGYIAFSQYMLIWYGNIPEETGWFFRRGVATHAPNVWSYVIILILVAHFLVPFVVLLNRSVKRRRGLLTFWAVWMLVMHWIDLYWLVMPELTTERLPLGIAELSCLAGMGLIFVGGLAWWSRARSLVPLADPRLGESLAFKNL